MEKLNLVNLSVLNFEAWQGKCPTVGVGQCKLCAKTKFYSNTENLIEPNHLELFKPLIMEKILAYCVLIRVFAVLYFTGEILC